MAVMDQDRPVTVVTGASSGIGFAAARGLAQAGHRVIALGRDPERIAEKKAELAKAAPADAVDWVQADFASMADVDKAAAAIAGLTDHIDILVNNAGGLLDRRIATPDGLEATFAINHLAPFLLTARLMPQLEAAKQAHVIAVSSIGHTMIDDMVWDDLQLEDDFDAFKAYAQSKLANVLFTRELARRTAGKGIIASAVHPGMVTSRFPLSGGAQVIEGYRQAEQAGHTVSEEQGADTIMWLATDAGNALPSGGYFADRSRVDPSAAAQDATSATRLWEISEQLAGLR